MSPRGGSVILIVVALCCIGMPVSAVLLEVTYLGTVTGLDPAAGTVSISATDRYGCSYSNGQAQCGWIPRTPSIVTCPVPDASVYSFLSVGDAVEATSIGGEEGALIAIARLQKGSDQAAGLVTDFAGDPARVQSAYYSGYQVDATENPDCSTCYGTRCTARSATVTVTRIGSTVIQKELLPGESAAYSGDGSSISVTFVRGQTSSYACPGAEGSGMMGGIQPVSVFLIHITPVSGGGAGVVVPVINPIIIPDVTEIILPGITYDTPFRPVNIPTQIPFQTPVSIPEMAAIPTPVDGLVYEDVPVFILTTYSMPQDVVLPLNPAQVLPVVQPVDRQSPPFLLPEMDPDTWKLVPYT